MRFLNTLHLLDKIALRLRMQTEFHIIEHDQISLATVDQCQYRKNHQGPLTYCRRRQSVARLHVEDEFLPIHLLLCVKDTLTLIHHNGLLD